MLTGIPLSGNRNLSNLGVCNGLHEITAIVLTYKGSILLCGIAIVVTLLLLWRANRKQAAVGRRYVLAACTMRVDDAELLREFQLFLIGYIIVSICEIFTVGGFPLASKVRLVRRQPPKVRTRV